MTTPKVTPKSLLAYLRKFSGGDRPLWLQRFERELWVSSAYWAMRPNPATRVALDALWDLCNLVPGPMRFVADIAVTRLDEDPPELGGLVPDLSTLRAIDSRPTANGILKRELEDGELYEMWRRFDGSWSTVNGDYSDFLREHGEPRTWMQGETPETLLVGIDGSGQISALLMPIKVGNERVLIRDNHLPPTLFDV